MKSNATFNHLLSNTSGEFANNRSEFIASILFPFFPSRVQAGIFTKFGRENMLNIPKLKARAPGAPYQRLDLEVGEGKFATRDYGAEIALDDRQKKIYQSGFAADRAKVLRTTRTLLVNKERRARDLINSGAIPNSTPGTKWDAAGADFFGDIDAAKEVIHDNCGIDPNVMTLPREVFNVLKHHDKVLERIKYVQKGVTTADILAELFGVDHLAVAGGVENTANEGQALSISKIWGDNVTLAYVSKDMDLESPTFARTFGWTGNTPATGEFAVKTYREDKANSWVHQLMHDVEENIVAPACAYNLTDVLT